MAISDIYNSLTFGGINSLDYGIYISGPGVFNAPARDVEFVDVPGRNGAIEIDKGHWNNIEVTYTAGTFGDDQSDFAQKINAFRNAIVSQIGYQRITDTYNPEEYRLGIYASGLSVDPANRNSAGEFDLVFNCKPQRYLLDGEDEITVTSGDTITNPTLYESGPLLKIEGDGIVNINLQSIEITSESYGIIELDSATYYGLTSHFNVNLLNQGDLVIVDSCIFQIDIEKNVEDSFSGDVGVTLTNTNFPNFNYSTEIVQLNENTRRIIVDLGKQVFPFQSTPSIFSATFRASLRIMSGGQTYYPDAYATLRLITGVTSEGEGYARQEVQRGTVEAPIKRLYTRNYVIGPISGDSTVSVLGHPTMIDLEIGDAYKIESGEYIDLNRYIALPSDLPKLKPGGNEITFDNTITDLKITPRWWEL